MNSAIATPPLMAMFLFMMSAALKRMAVMEKRGSELILEEK